METTLVQFIETMKQHQPTDIINLPQVRAKYISVFDSIWKEGGEAAYNRESRYFNAVLSNLISQSKNPQLVAQQMDRFSIYNAILESAITNLSLEPGVRALAYLTTRNKKEIAPDGREVWTSNLNFTVSGYGEMVARVRCGQIRHADNPVVVYENDELTVRDTDGKKSVEYVCHFPHTAKAIVACYMRITRADGSIDYATMYEEDWKRLSAYSEKQNKNGGANALYNVNGQIDPGFLQAKLIKHAFKTYPKVRIGATAIMADEDDDAMNIMQHDECYSGITPPFEGATPQYEEHEEATTYEAVNVCAGVKVQSDNDDIF